MHVQEHYWGSLPPPFSYQNPQRAVTPCFAAGGLCTYFNSSFQFNSLHFDQAKQIDYLLSMFPLSSTPHPTSLNSVLPHINSNKFHIFSLFHFERLLPRFSTVKSTLNIPSLNEQMLNLYIAKLYICSMTELHVSKRASQPQGRGSDHVSIPRCVCECLSK